MSEELRTDGLEHEQDVVEKISLPYDYDDVWGVSGANKEIRSIILQVIKAKDEEHKVEVAELVEMYKQRLDVAETAVAELTERNQKLQAYNIEQIETINQLKSELHASKESLTEAENKRDNAVKIAEEAKAEVDAIRVENERLKRTEASLKSQIDELEERLRTFKSKPANVGIKLISTLPTLTEEELKEKRKREQLEFINRRLAEKFGDTNPLPVPPLPSVEKAVETPEEDVTEEALAEQSERVRKAAEADAETFPVVSSDSGEAASDNGAKEASGDARGAGEEADAPTLEERVSYLEAQMKEVVRRVGILEGDFRDHIGLP